MTHHLIILVRIHIDPEVPDQRWSHTSARTDDEAANTREEVSDRKEYGTQDQSNQGKQSDPFGTPS